MRVYSKIRKTWCDFPNRGYVPLVRPDRDTISFKAETEHDANAITEIIEYLEMHGSESLYYLLTNNK